jgi:Tfp pilus assembly protein PilN
MLSLAQAIPPGVRLSSWNIEGHRHSVSGEARNVEELSTLVAALQKMPGSPKVRLRTIDRVGTASNAPVHFDIEVSP